MTIEQVIIIIVLKACTTRFTIYSIKHSLIDDNLLFSHVYKNNINLFSTVFA